ncbi:MAG: SRPBCC family protein [Thermoplasmata archaeon]
MDDTLDPILIQVTVPLPIPMLYGAFTDPTHLKGWLCDTAEVDLRPGGKYHLGWKAPVAFESQGEVREMTPDLDFGFSWQAPPPFAALMNRPELKTHVYVRFAESPEGIDITLEHSGWESGDAWEEARSWHFHFWDDRLQTLKAYMIKVAYG